MNSPSLMETVPQKMLTFPLTEKVCIITTDGRNLVGNLVAHDNNTNLVCIHFITALSHDCTPEGVT